MHQQLPDSDTGSLGEVETPSKPVIPQLEDEIISHVDNYLTHAFDAVAEEIRHEAEASGHSETEIILLPMLVQLRSTSWNPEKIPDCRVIAKMGDIVACLGSLRTVIALQRDPSVLGIEASRPISSLDCVNSIPLIKADTVHHGTVPEKGDELLIAIIDGGIDVLHQAFRDSTGNCTRILAIWDQTDESGLSPNISADCEYGTGYTQGQINQYLQTGTAPPHLRDTNGHGTHVASIAAGRAVMESQFAGGVAPEAKILVVIPKLQVGPTDPYSLGYSVSLVGALSYINAFAEQRGLPVVVNLSQGMNAGAHDGTSYVEAAFDNFTKGGREPGCVVVKSAGNERGHKGHAKLSMGNDQTDSLTWYSSQPHRGQDVIELWFKSCDEIRFRVQDPSGAKTPSVDWLNRTTDGYFPYGNRYKISYIRYHHDNGDSCLTITILPGLATSIKLGTWSLEIVTGSIKSQGDIQAWMERREDHLIGFTNHLNEEMTLTIPGTAHTVISVGSVATSRPFSVSAYSSYGPTRDGRNKPELAAPGEQITAARGNSFVELSTLSGTSMATPHVTGAIALLFSHWNKRKSSVPDWKQFNAAQIRALISQTAQTYNGYWRPGIGFGVLDVENS